MLFEEEGWGRWLCEGFWGCGGVRDGVSFVVGIGFPLFVEDLGIRGLG